MAKFCGKIGFVESVKKGPGIFVEKNSERKYRGEVIRNTRRWNSGDNMNASLQTTNQISIVADAFAINNLQRMRYVEYSGVFWSIASADLQRPRIVLSLGDIYHKDQNPPEEP